MSEIEEFYRNKYSNKNFQEVYLVKRLDAYRAILNILKEFKISSVLDIGCSYGLFVELCNETGLNAFGYDLPINELMDFHKKLPFSKGKFIYGTINEDDNGNMSNNIDAVVLLDTLSHIEHMENIKNINARYIIIKENCNNLYIRRRYKKYHEKTHRKNMSPMYCLDLFNNYIAHQIYPSRYLFKLRNPGYFSLCLLNALFPTYTLVLKRSF